MALAPLQKASTYVGAFFISFYISRTFNKHH